MRRMSRVSYRVMKYNKSIEHIQGRCRSVIIRDWEIHRLERSISMKSVKV